jgi:hypothetical protein
MGGEAGRLAEIFQRMEEAEFAGIECALEMLEKQTAEQARQHARRQKESGPRGDPAAAIG